uniref:Uncharacterized protein n=1 Tax=Panagrolaimus superbus TaxID=310955 RepID=A0A914YPX9_9BILA
MVRLSVRQAPPNNAWVPQQDITVTQPNAASQVKVKSEPEIQVKAEVVSRAPGGNVLGEEIILGDTDDEDDQAVPDNQMEQLFGRLESPPETPPTLT